MNKIKYREAKKDHQKEYEKNMTDEQTQKQKIHQKNYRKEYRKNMTDEKNKNIEKLKKYIR